MTGGAALASAEPRPLLSEPAYAVGMPFPPLVAPVPALTEGERIRTRRHSVLPELGELGQRRLAAAHVAVLGAGGLGSPAILALAAAGVGHLTVIDDDAVEPHNLQRQIVHTVTDIGHPKTQSAARAATGLSPETRVRTVTERLTLANAERILHGADLVLDGSDSFATRGAVAAACESIGIPLVWGSVQAWSAQVTVFWSRPPSGHDPLTLADLFPPAHVGEPPSCSITGVLGSLTMQVGAMLATEAIKLITGSGDPLFGRVLLVDGLRAQTREVPLRPSRQRPADSARQLAEHSAAPPTISAEHLAALIARGATPALLDVREDHEVAESAIAGIRHVPLADVLVDPAALAAGHVVVICGSGGRATRAARALNRAGADAVVLDGGMRAWRAREAQPA